VSIRLASIEPIPEEQAVMRRIRRAKLFSFLREHRHELFDEEFQAQLGEIYHHSTLGRPPVALALATILQPTRRSPTRRPSRLW
jgi:hypothetical protein